MEWEIGVSSRIAPILHGGGARVVRRNARF
jgi:hypothetical protein